MPAPIRSLNDRLSQENSRGSWAQQFYFFNVANITAANSTSGYKNMAAYPQFITVPALVDTSYMTSFACGFGNTNVGIGVIGLVYELGTLTVSGNSFSAGVSAPSKQVYGASAAATCTFDHVYLDITTTLGGATTPVLTITYTNQDGTGSRTATMTLPTNPAVDTGFDILSHLQSGDSGVRAITNMSISTGTSGVIKVYGMLELGRQTNTSGASSAQGYSKVGQPDVLYPIVAGDVIGAIQYINTAGQSALFGHFICEAVT